MEPLRRRSYQKPGWSLECCSFEDSMDFLEYGPFKSFLSIQPTQKTAMTLLYQQPDYSPAYLKYVVDAFRRIKLDEHDGRMQFLTHKFYFWLRDVFIPFLQRVEGVIPDIFVQVDSFFKAVGLPVISQIIKKLRNHFSEVPLCIIRSIFLSKWRRNRCLHLRHQSSTAHILCGFALASLQMKPVYSQLLPSLPQKDALILIAKLEYFKCIEGKSLRRRLLGLSVAQDLIKRLSGSHREIIIFLLMRFLLMRVFGPRSFA